MSAIRTSTVVFLTSVVLAAISVLLLLYQQRQRAYFSSNTTMVMGTVLDRGDLLRRLSSSHSYTEYLCWVSYTFTPADGAPRRNWRLWQPACGVSRGRPILIQYVIGNPDINRPGGSESSFAWWLFFFAAGVGAVIGVMVRRSEGNDRQDLGALLRS